MPSFKQLTLPASPGRRALLGYFACLVLVALTTLAVHTLQRLLSDDTMDHTLRPYGIAFIIPVVIGALIAGWRCGAFTLALSLAATYTILMGHATPDGVNASETTELAFIALVGGAVLVAVEMQQRNLRLLREIAEISEQRQSFFRDVLVNVTDGKLNLVDSTSHLPSDFADPVGLLALRRDNLGVFRKMVAEASKKAGLPQERTDDLITAASECAMNAVVHGGGTGTGTVTWDGADKVMVRVADTGRGIALENLPSATLEKGFTTAGSMGFGMKMMLTSADRVWLLTGPAGTVVVMEQYAAPPPPAWLVKQHGELLETPRQAA